MSNMICFVFPPIIIFNKHNTHQKVKMECLPYFLETLLEALRTQEQMTVFRAPYNYCNQSKKKKIFINPQYTVKYFSSLNKMKRTQE